MVLSIMHHLVLAYQKRNQHQKGGGEHSLSPGGIKVGGHIGVATGGAGPPLLWLHPGIEKIYIFLGGDYCEKWKIVYYEILPSGRFRPPGKFPSYATWGTCPPRPPPNCAYD